MGLDWREGTNTVCAGRETLNYISLQKVAWNFFPLAVSHPPSRCPAEQGQPSAVSGAEPGDSTTAPRCAFKPPLPSKRRAPQGEEAGGRWLEAQRHWEEGARFSSTAKYPDSSPDWTDFVQLSALPCVHAGKEQSGVPGWVPACGGKDQWVLLAGEVDGGSFHLHRGSRRALQRRDGGRRRRTLAPSPVRTRRLNAMNLVCFVNEIKVTRRCNGSLSTV